MSANFPSENANDHKGKVLDGLDGYEYASIKNNNNEYEWKLIDDDEMNAINIFKFWHNDEDINSYIIHDEAKAITLINDLTDELKKYNIHLFYIDYMGKWYDGEYHFVDYLWDEVCDKIKDDDLGDMNTLSFIFTDDVYLLRALKNGKLYFQHNILDKDVENLVKTIKKITGIELHYSSENSIILNIPN